MDIAEKMAADIALDMGGGEWKDGKWYSKFHRDAWIKAVKPYADEIERLREKVKELEEIMEENKCAVGYLITKRVLKRHGMWLAEEAMEATHEILGDNNV